MGWNIRFYDNGVRTDDYDTRVSNLTYNYAHWTECHEYWQPIRDYDGKTVSEAIAIMERVVSKMIVDGIKVIDKNEWLLDNPKMQLTHLEDMLLWLTTNYSVLICLPRHLVIKLV